MAKRQTIGENPLDGLFQAITENNGTFAAVPEEEKQAFSQVKQQKSSQKQRITVQISENVIERIKNAVYWTPGLTLAWLAEEAFTKAVDVLEEERKTPFPKRKEELKTGRPIK
jgi:predicted DNA binding CopG/RHH family protein